MSAGMGPFPILDETPIEFENDTFINSDAKLVAHVKLIEAGLLYLNAILKEQPHKSDEELITLRLGVRLFNSAAAAMKLLRAGYYQPALTLVRDIMETGALLDLFNHDRTQLTDWLSLEPKKRDKQFSPFKVRLKLEGVDGRAGREREDAYKRLCAYAAHVTPEGFKIIVCTR